ncbi:hypothetical protein GGF39_000132 [Coemansia sp. RSA 1721]|nr:hypothetical protein GGF39_000132 [Coemansia sp. RSA 1721]
MSSDIGNSSSVPTNVLLRVSACTTPEELSQVLSAPTAEVASQQPLDAATLLHAVAECFDAQQLLSVVSGNNALEHTAQGDWVAACIQRAEDIDQWTGRIDWATRWLEQVLAAQEAKNSPIAHTIQRALDHAYILCAMQTTAIDTTLGQLNAMDPSQFVDWLVSRASGPTPVDAATLSSVICRRSEYRDAWNKWWGRQLGLAPWHHELFKRLATEGPKDMFAPEILLASVLSASGPCGSIEYAQIVAHMPFMASVPERCRRSARLAPEVVQAAQAQGNTENLVCVLETQKSEAKDQTMGAVAVLVHAVDLMQTLGFGMSIHGMLAMLASDETQRRTLVRAIRTALQTDLAPDVSPWRTFLQLHDLAILDALTVDQIKHQYLSQLLVHGQLTQARDLIDAEPCFTEPRLERDAACQAARQLVDGSESGDSSDVTLARSILTQTLSEQWREEPSVVDELALIDASQLSATLRRPGDPGVVPAEIRLAADAFMAVQTVLLKCPTAYRRPRVVREIASLLLAKDRGQGSPRVQTIAEALVCSLMLQSAVSAADHDAAYEFSRSLQGARPVLASALESAADKDSNSKQMQQMAQRAVQSICAGCLSLAESWVDGPESRRLEALALALRLCPASEIPGILGIWRRIASPDQLSPALDGADDANAADTAESVRLALLGPVDAAEPASPTEPDSPGFSADVDAVRSFDPAIIRRCLRHALGNADNRRVLLLEWLDFSLTTTTEPRTAKSAAFRQALERTLVDEYPAAAIECLQTRVLPQIDQTNHVMVQSFYTSYARLNRALGNDGSADQAEIRAELAGKLRLVPSLREVDFSRLVDVLVSGEKDVGGLCSLADSPRDQTAMAETLVYDMALVRPIDDNTPMHGDFWEPAQLASAIALSVLTQELDQQRMAEFASSISMCAPLITSPEDRRVLQDRVAFDGTTAALIGIDMRRQVLRLLEPQTEAAQNRALAYVEFIARLEAIRDPQSHAVMTRRAVGLFDTAQGVFLQSSTPAPMLWQLLDEALQKMVADAGLFSAYLVCNAYQAAVELVSRWGDSDGVVDGLDSVYSQAIDRVADQRHLLVVCTDALKLDAVPGTAQFRKQLGATMRDIVYGARSVACAPDAQTRLALLDLIQEHAIGDQDHGDIRVHLLAAVLWHVEVPVSEIRENKTNVWLRLLDATEAGDDRQIDALVKFMAEWKTAEECVSRLLVWAAKKHAPERVVVAMLERPELFGEKAGESAFGELLESVGDDPRMAPALAVLGMTYPIGLWAERCMEPVIMVLLHEPAEKDDEEVEEEADGWGLDDDVEIEGPEQTRTSASDLEYAAARDQILQSSLLHVCIMLRGFVPASLASPELLTQVGQTCLWQHAIGDAERHIVDTVPGGMAELLRRTVHVLCDVGMDDVAIAWTQVFLHVPRHYRFAGEGEGGRRWIEHLDCVVLGRTEVVEEEGEQPVEEENEAGWGDSDVELELELESESGGGADQHHTAIKRDAENSPRLRDYIEEAGAEEGEAAGWGDDDDDIDLDAELDNLQD